MKLVVRKVLRKGRGIFADRNFKKGDVIEVCPVVVLSAKDRKVIDQTALYDYYFSWGRDKKKAAIALGFGSFYNHSYAPNAVYKKDFLHHEIRFIAVSNISKGKEIVVNYNGKVDDQTSVWFESS
ncbi:MAG TPA: SET domain-containing protein [Patescibacteria group bacterium]|nr:SET domain-containing protein [Patescibacteria group bacterium]